MISSRLKPIKLSFACVVFFGVNYCWAQSTSCRSKALNDSRVEYQYQGRRISIIGWTHPLIGDNEKGLKATLEAAKSAAGGDCAGAKKVFQSFLESSKDLLVASNRVEMSLETLYAKNPFGALGVEHSPEELREIIDASTGENKVDRVLHLIRKKCPALSAHTEDFFKVFPGPQYSFAKKSKGKVLIKPMEDHKLKVASTQQVPKESMNFDPDKESLSPKAKDLTKKIQTNIGKGLSPSDSEISAVVAAEENPQQRAKLERVFKDVKHVMSLVDQRNNFIVNSAVQNGGDVVIVIGNAHVSGLARDLDLSCKSSKPHPSAKPMPQEIAPVAK